MSGFDIWRYCSETFGREPWITEAGKMPMADGVAALDPMQPRKARAVVIFILKWENYAAMGTMRPGDEYSLMWHPELYAEFKQAQWLPSSPPVIEIPPEEDHVPEEATIGSGLLSMMEEDDTTPAQSQSTWLPLGKDPAEVEECYGSNGTRYAWLLNGSGGFRFPPDR